MCFSIALGTSNSGIRTKVELMCKVAFAISELGRTKLDNNYRKRLGQIIATEVTRSAVLIVEFIMFVAVTQ